MPLEVVVDSYHANDVKIYSHQQNLHVRLTNISLRYDRLMSKSNACFVFSL